MKIVNRHFALGSALGGFRDGDCLAHGDDEES